MSTRRWGMLALVAIVSLWGSPSTPAMGAEKATLRLEWRLTGFHLPFYWALAKGYYSQEGIDLTIGEGTGSAQTVQILSGNNDTFGFADGLVMAAGVGKGMPMKAIAAPIQLTPWAYVSYAATGIKTPQDLVGKQVAVVAAHETLHNLFLQQQKIPPDKVMRRTATAQTRNVLLAEKKVDAFLSIIIGSPLDFVVKERQGGEKVSFLRFTDWGVNAIGYVLMAHQQTMAERPGVVRGFLRATRRGWQEVPSNMDEALRIAVSYAPSGKGFEEGVRLGMEESLKLARSPHAAGKPWGWTAPADWEQTQAVLVSTKQIEKAVPIEQYFTNAFIAE